MKSTISSIKITLSSLLLSVLLSCNNSTEIDFNDNFENTAILRDTVYSEEIIGVLKYQVSDYLSISSKSQMGKFLKYTPDFLYECANSDGELLSKRYDRKSFLTSIFLNSIDQKAKQSKKMKANNYSLVHSIDKNIRTYCNDSTLFANLELITYLYKRTEKRDSILSNFVCISDNKGKNWTFLDKDGCKDFLICHYSDNIANYIMEK